MSRVPTDADEDEIRRILETMWERTSRSEHEPTPAHDRGNSASIRLQSGDRNLGTRKYVPSLDHHTNGNGDNGSTQASPPTRRSLFDVLHGATVTVGENMQNALSFAPDRHGTGNDVIPNDEMKPPRIYATGAGGSTPHESQKQLSSLNSVENGPQGRKAANGEDAMHSPSQDATAKNGHALNGATHPEQSSEIRAGSEQDPRAAAPPPTTAAADTSPPPAATQSGSHASASGDEPVKRKMVPFKDTRMNQMSGHGSPSPSAPPQVSSTNNVAQNSPSPSAPATTVPQQPQAGPNPAKSTEHARETAAELMRPVLRQWLGENMPKIVEGALQIEVDQTAKAERDKNSDK